MEIEGWVDPGLPARDADAIGRQVAAAQGDAQKKLEDWRKYYNEERPHGAIGQKPPSTLLKHDGAASPPP